MYCAEVWSSVMGSLIIKGVNAVLYLLLLALPAAFSISSESSQVVLIAISSAVAIILLTVLLYVLIGRSVHEPACRLSSHPNPHSKQ